MDGPEPIQRNASDRVLESVNNVIRSYQAIYRLLVERGITDYERDFVGYIDDLARGVRVIGRLPATLEGRRIVLEMLDELSERCIAFQRYTEERINIA